MCEVSQFMFTAFTYENIDTEWNMCHLYQKYSICIFIKTRVLYIANEIMEISNKKKMH